MTFYDTLAVLFYFGAFCGITYALCVFALSFYRAFRVAIATQRIKRDTAKQIEALRLKEQRDQERAWASRIRPNGLHQRSVKVGTPFSRMRESQASGSADMAETTFKGGWLRFWHTFSLPMPAFFGFLAALIAWDTAGDVLTWICKQLFV